MSAKTNLFLLLCIVLTAGCNMLADRQRPPQVGTVPPYWQSENELKELRSFHDHESAKMETESESVHIVRNREMERLAAAEEELEQEKLWQEDYEQTIERREKWFSWFNKKEKKEMPALSSRNESAAQSVR